jgi:PAS domain S-box-containing protein
MGSAAGGMQEIAELRALLDAAEAALSALRAGGADAFLTLDGVVGLDGADKPYRVFFDAMNEGALTLDGDGRILHCNPQFSAMLGRSIAGIRGTLLRDLGGPQCGPTINGLLAGNAQGTCEALLTAPGGAMKPVQLSFRPLNLNSRQFFCVVVTDLSERLQAVEMLRKSSEKFSSLYAAMTEGVALHELVFDTAGKPVDYRLLDVNPAFESIIGVSREAALGQLASEVYGTSSAPYLERYAGVAVTGRPVRFEARFEPMAKVFSISVFSPAKHQFATVFSDITEQKNSEAELEQHRYHLEEQVLARTLELAAARDAAEAASRAKSVFLANMSHELRTPMNGVMGMIDLVLRRATDPQQIDWLNKSKASAKHLLSVINNILDISKVEADRLTLEEKNFSLARVIDETLQMQEAPAQGRGLRLYCDVDRTVPDLLCGDAFRLKQIVLNFTSNAIKFSENGKITVRARLVEKDRQSVMLRIEVSDQGIGISAEQQSHLFRAFSQADASDTRKYGGTGLGLIIAKRIAMLMGGDVGVVSETGCGSTFWATVRLRHAAAEALSDGGKQMEPARETLAQKFQGARILLAEDEPVTREIVTFLLEDAGLCADVAVNGQEALDKARDGNYALILMDMQMPILNGIEATRAIRLLPGMAAIPILALTANAFDGDRERCLAAGMNDHIGKPVEPDALCATLLHWLQRSAK